MAVVSIGGRFYIEFSYSLMSEALRRARGAQLEFPGRLVFIGDGQHVWRIDEL